MHEITYGRFKVGLKLACALVCVLPAVALAVVYGALEIVLEAVRALAVVSEKLEEASVLLAKQAYTTAKDALGDWKCWNRVAAEVKARAEAKEEVSA